MRGAKPRPAVDRVLAKVEKVPGGCWIFGGFLNKGYGTVGVGSKSDGTARKAPAHTVVYEALVGPIPAGLELDHVKARGCVSKACCNPDHLEPVTHRENGLRGDSPLAQKARQTHCKRGHSLAGGNIYRQPSRPSVRICRECDRIRSARWRAEHAAFSGGA